MKVGGTLKVSAYISKKSTFLDRLTARGKRLNKMFSIVTETWNPVSGCLHQCIYCWARRLAEARLRNSERYKNGFIPKFNKEELHKRLRSEIIFVTDMGDLFGSFVPDEWIYGVLEVVQRFPSKTFLFLTKNPSRYRNFDFPRNVMLGATIETDNDDGYERISNAPKPSDRIKAMISLDWDMKFLSIEPILDFTPSFLKRILEINPLMIYVGYDNYNTKLPEPSLGKTIRFIQKLSGNGLLVFKKTIRRAWYER